MDDFAEIQAARREFDQVVSEIQRLPEYSGFLAEPTVEDVMTASDDRPLCYVIASESDGLALIAHNRHYAVDDAVISYVPNARSLTVAKKRASGLAANTLLAVADPRPTDLSPLDSAAHEAAAIAAMCAASTVLVGEDATAEKVRP